MPWAARKGSLCKVRELLLMRYCDVLVRLKRGLVFQEEQGGHELVNPL
jgi:hypothetical protein